jgi:HD-GYP domain-containing protein (c-di-GMP phosphodiesterase class II)
MAVADVVEAMISHRPYRASLGLDCALTEIARNKDKLYDADAVDACLKVFGEKGFEFQDGIGGLLSNRELFLPAALP